MKHKRTKPHNRTAKKNKSHRSVSISRLLAPIALTLILNACTTLPSRDSALDITQQPTLSSQQYLLKADTDQQQQNNWLIMALKASISENNSQQVALLNAKLAEKWLSTDQQAEWRLVKAKYLLDRKQPQQALVELNFANNWQLPAGQWKRYHTLRANAFNALKAYDKAIRSLISLTNFVPIEQQDVIANTIWQNANAYSQPELLALTNQTLEPELYGWLQIALEMKTFANNIPLLQTHLKEWFIKNPTHLATIHTPQDVKNILTISINVPKKIALLLPLTGKFSNQAQLVRDGFVMARMNDQQQTADSSLIIIDTNEHSTAEIRDQIYNNQIDFVVGPLVKENIEQLQQVQMTTNNPIPTLALNIPSEFKANTNICFLTLSPEQEAEQAASYLNQQGYKYPLILAHQGALGQRVAEAFQHEWQKLSDTKVELSYFGNKNQLQKEVNNIFGLQESQVRIAQMNTLANMQLESQPRSRRDIDSVYIIAKNSELSLLKPFIEVAINPDTKPPKLFADSYSNNGVEQYEDLSGVQFSDIPMLLAPDLELKAQMDELWPNSSNSDKRLQALGMDAYKLVKELPQMKSLSNYTVQGQTGILSIGDNCIIKRQINWSEHGATH